MLGKKYKTYFSTVNFSDECRATLTGPSKKIVNHHDLEGNKGKWVMHWPSKIIGPFEVDNGAKISAEN